MRSRTKGDLVLGTLFGLFAMVFVVSSQTETAAWFLLLSVLFLASGARGAAAAVQARNSGAAAAESRVHPGTEAGPPLVLPKAR